MVHFQILHFSDLHLYVDAKGRERPNYLRSAPVRILSSLGFEDLNPHSPEALDAFCDTVDGLTQQPGPTIIVQSGDVEAYGMIDDHFAGWDFLKNRRAVWHANSIEWAEVFGNHDVWPGTIPLFGGSGSVSVEPEFRALYCTSIMPDETCVDIPGDPPCRVEIYRLNTVCVDQARNLFAKGSLDPDCLLKGSDYPLSNSRHPLKELIDLSRQNQKDRPDERVIRVVVLHHPPNGEVRNPKDLLKLLGKCKDPRFHFCLSGHTHMLDPSHGTTLTDPSQTVQLVTGTATRRTKLSEEPRSFSLYTFDVDDDEITVHREIFEHTSRIEPVFAQQPREQLGVVPF